MTAPADRPLAAEFFELFKTPWEPALPGRHYRVVLSTRGYPHGIDADVFIVYGSKEEGVDRNTTAAVIETAGPADVHWNDAVIPIYGSIACLSGSTVDAIFTSQGLPVDWRCHADGRAIHRIGYDLFTELRHLLTEGQPASKAITPALELHIAALRDVLRQTRVSFIEIPPRPAACDFVCCLTHDIDFYEIRRHKADRTLAGFAMRASVGTFIDLARGRRTPTEAIRNWIACASLPLVFVGLARDLWRPFEDYERVEDGKRSTFFIVPFKNRPGQDANAQSDARRAVPYQASEICDDVRAAVTRGCEIAVHGIDAWRDADAGRDELAQVAAVTGKPSAGVRMHWLYFASDSPRQLEAAGFDYDSTWGYNDAVGYKAGTSQVFRLAGADSLLELPLAIMDSALLFPGRMGLSSDDAIRECRPILANAKQFGGTVVINWHDRSLSPERLWNRTYEHLLQEINGSGDVWFCGAAEAVQWFRWRRSIRFEATGCSTISVTSATRNTSLPAAVVRTYRNDASPTRIEERQFTGGEPLRLDV